MTIDSEGCFWVAFWNGSRLVRFDRDGNELERFAFPARKVSSVAFGGEDLTEVYVTTANRDGKAEEGPGAGALFRLKTSVKGVLEFNSKITGF